MPAFAEATQGLENHPAPSFGQHLPPRPHGGGRSAAKGTWKSSPGRSPSPSSRGGRIGQMAVARGRIAPGLQHRLAQLQGTAVPREGLGTVTVTAPAPLAQEVSPPVQQASRPAEGLATSACVAVITTVGTGAFDI
jgi:hypothetical protein